MRSQAVQKTRVLHVTECYGGGVRSAIGSYVANSSDIVEHHLLYRVRKADSRPSQASLQPFASSRQLDGFSVEAVRELWKAIRNIKPHVVHLHSSFAGFLGRFALPSRALGRRLRLVYTPHGFSFERQDISRLSRRAYTFAERFLARWNTDCLAGCSPREVALAKPWSTRVIYLPNVATTEYSATEQATGSSDRALRVVCVGRIVPARDPAFIGELARGLRGSGVTIRWVGAGDSETEQLLTQAGVEVTGWLDQSDVATQLNQCDVYFHPGLWDGMPMSVLEACKASKPIVVRDIAAFEFMPREVKCRSVTEAANLLDSLKSADLRRANCMSWKSALSDCTEEGQRRALRVAYSIDTGSTRRPHEDPDSPRPADQ